MAPQNHTSTASAQFARGMMLRLCMYLCVSTVSLVTDNPVFAVLAAVAVLAELVVYGVKRGKDRA